MLKPKIYKPKPLKNWKFVFCNAWDKRGGIDAVLMSETGHTGDNMFHHFIQLFKGGKRKTGEEIQKEASEIYDGLLKDIKRKPKNYLVN